MEQFGAHRNVSGQATGRSPALRVRAPLPASSHADTVQQSHLGLSVDDDVYARPRAKPASRRRPILILACVTGLGAALFAASGGFHRATMSVEPLPVQFDHALVAAGLGINEVMLSGLRNTKDSEIYGALGLERAGSLLRFDVNAARRNVERLPWVRTADIVRVLPDKLKIHIEERRPAAIWEQDGRSMLVDFTGRVLANLAPENTSSLGLTRISGAGAPRALSRLMAALEPHTEIHSRLESARRTGERRWTLELAGGMSVHLPADREGEALLRLARQHEGSGLLDLGAQIIDLRQDGVIAIRPNAVTAPAARAPSRRSLL